jgi:hypothetical protein
LNPSLIKNMTLPYLKWVHNLHRDQLWSKPTALIVALNQID